jgi:cytochrome P450
LAEHEKEFLQKKVSSAKKPMPFLDQLYSLRDSMSYQDTSNILNLFLAAGFDTTGKTMSAILLLLAMNPHEQEKLHNEIASVLSSETDNIDEEKLAKIDYLDLVIKESLRLFPQGLILAREATADVQLSMLISMFRLIFQNNFEPSTASCTIPKGATIFIMNIFMHTNKAFWGDDVMEFKPDRFREENISKVHPYAYNPFSGGQRICPGMKYANLAMKIFLSKFLMKYRVKTELRYEDLELQVRLTLTLKQGFMVKVERR